MGSKKKVFLSESTGLVFDLARGVRKIMGTQANVLTARSRLQNERDDAIILEEEQCTGGPIPASGPEEAQTLSDEIGIVDLMAPISLAPSRTYSVEVPINIDLLPRQARAANCLTGIVEHLEKKKMEDVSTIGSINEAMQAAITCNMRSLEVLRRHLRNEQLIEDLKKAKAALESELEAIGAEKETCNPQVALAHEESGEWQRKWHEHQVSFVRHKSDLTKQVQTLKKVIARREKQQIELAEELAQAKNSSRLSEERIVILQAAETERERALAKHANVSSEFKAFKIQMEISRRWYTLAFRPQTLKEARSNFADLEAEIQKVRQFEQKGRLSINPPSYEETQSCSSEGG